MIILFIKYKHVGKLMANVTIVFRKGASVLIKMSLLDVFQFLSSFRTFH